MKFNRLNIVNREQYCYNNVLKRREKIEKEVMKIYRNIAQRK